MEQTDGSHEPSYWRELAEFSIDDSQLTSQVGSGDFSTQQMQRIATDLQQAQRNNTAIPGFDIGDHMLYLLETACDDVINTLEDKSIDAALSRLQLDPDEIEGPFTGEVIAILNRSRDLKPGGSYADAALVMMEYLHKYVSRAPANWKVLFSPLVSKRIA